MTTEKWIQELKETDFYLDQHGRIVINNDEILKAINGAAGGPSDADPHWNGACHNSRCG